MTTTAPASPRTASPRTGTVSVGAASKFDPSMTSSPIMFHHQHHYCDEALRPFLKYVERKERRLLSKLNEVKGRVQSHRASLKELKDAKKLLLRHKGKDAKENGSVAVPTFTETTARSMVKSLLWRVIAGSITFATTVRFSGSVDAALRVVGADFFSKSLTMFLGERLMNKSQVGRQAGAGGDHVSRSLAKAMIWRLFAVCNTLTMAVFVAKDVSIASKIASTDAVFKTGLMFVYERIWSRIHWGKEYYLVPTSPVQGVVAHKVVAPPSFLSVAMSKLKARMSTFRPPRLIPQHVNGINMIPAYAPSNVTAFDAGFGI